MLKTRILTALLLLALFIPALFFLPNAIWSMVMLVLSLLALYEWGGMIGLGATWLRAYMFASILLSILVIYLLFQVSFHLFFGQALILFLCVAIFWILLVPIWIGFGFRVKHLGLLMALGWFMLGSVWLALTCAQRVNPWMLLIIIATIWIADSAAYFAGKQFGKHKLAPAVSPGKTWEGVFGALLGVGVFGFFLKSYNVVDTWLIIPSLWLIAIVGVYGDLFESMFKRQANIKDSGHLLPGHGGLLDRIDGVIPAMPIGILMLYYYQYLQSTMTIG
jgi:phosphatidate cytidylyltransferase